MPRASAALSTRHGNRTSTPIRSSRLPAVAAWIALSQTIVCQSSLDGQPQQKKGRLTVACAHVDCNVLTNGAPVGETINRTFSQDVSEGPVAVSVSADGYESVPDQQIVNIKDGNPQVVKFELRPSRAALEKRGAALFLQMIAALGGEEGLRAAAALRGTGTLTLYRDGKPAFWQATLLLKLPDKSRFTVGAFQGDSHTYELISAGGVADLVKMGKGADLEELNLALHQLAEYQIDRTLQRLQDRSVAILATDLKPSQSEGTMLRAERGTEAYAIRLDPDFRPQEIFVESGGFDKGIKIFYSDYAQQGAAYFPRTLRIEHPGSAANGVKIRFDHVTLSPANLTDADFESKKGKTR